MRIDTTLDTFAVHCSLACRVESRLYQARSRMWIGIGGKAAARGAPAQRVGAGAATNAAPGEVRHGVSWQVPGPMLAPPCSSQSVLVRCVQVGSPISRSGGMQHRI